MSQYIQHTPFPNIEYNILKRDPTMLFQKFVFLVIPVKIAHISFEVPLCAFCQQPKPNR